MRKKKTRSGGKPTPRTGRGGTPPSGGKKPKKKQTTFDRKRQGRLGALISNRELVSLVMLLHCRGKKPQEVIREVAARKEFADVELLREDPYWILREVAKKGWLWFRPPFDFDYRDRILHAGKWPILQELDVVASFEVEVVARQAARQLLRMLRQVSARKGSVQVGVAGGHTVRAVMRALSDEMVDPVGEMLGKVRFQPLAAGFDPQDPSTNPNTFVAFFERKLIPAKIEFTGLSVPATVSPAMFEDLKRLDDIAEALRAVDDIDIFVTSGTSWHKHSILRERMEASDRKLLDDADIAGDVLWRPIGPNGPIEIETARRAFTLVELGQLKKDRQVLLALAPCGLCGELKGHLLRCILDAGIVTHVVADSGSAGQVVNSLPDPGGPQPGGAAA